jgi:hypothetical protein
MTHRYLLSCILALFCLNLHPDLHGQDSIAKTLDDARTLARQGRYRQLIDLLTPLLSSSALDTVDRGNALMLVAAGYDAAGNFSESHRALDQALSLLGNDPHHISDYTDALTNLSILYRDVGDVDAMKRTSTKALQLYEQANDHAGLIAIYVVLAENSANQRKPAEAERYLAQAQQASKQVNNIGDDYRIAIIDLQASIALLEGHSMLAISTAREGLDLRIRSNGEQRPANGWGYMLLGKAELQAGDIKSALADMRQGLDLLSLAGESGRVAYLYSELAYSEALAADGQRSQAKHIKADATQSLTNLYRDQCARCQINAAAFR